MKKYQNLFEFVQTIKLTTCPYNVLWNSKKEFENKESRYTL